MNDELDQELWDLLKEPVEEPAKTEKPVKTTKAVKAVKKESESHEKGTVITERRKKAMVIYLVGLFGIAFIIVLVSLLMKGVPGNNQVSNAQVEALQAQIQALETEKQNLQNENKTLIDEKEALSSEVETLKSVQEESDLKIYELNCLLVELTNASEYVESASTDANAQIEMLLQRIAAYETLVKAQNKFIDYDETLLEEAMKALESQLGHLSADAVNAYYMILEYMEQPYLGQ